MIAAGACAALAGPLFVVGCGGKPAATTTPTVTATRHIRPLAANAIRVHFKQAALVPAARAGHVCIVTYKTGHFCAKYVFGEIPAVAMKRKLRAKGWILVGSH
jgi:hypothetical protein